VADTNLQGPVAQNSTSTNNQVSLFISVDMPIPRAVIEERRRNKDLQIQAVCIAVTDSGICQNRQHWPDRMEVSVRSQVARVMTRNHKLGANGRDAPTDLTPWLNKEATSIQVSVKAVGQENCFLFGVRAVVPQSTEVQYPPCLSVHRWYKIAASRALQASSLSTPCACFLFTSRLMWLSDAAVRACMSRW
jgi:hypothetical protein